MRKVSSLFGLTLVALASTARAQEPTPVTVPPPATPAPVATDSATPTAEPAGQHGHWTLGLNVLPMALGRFISTPGGMRADQQAAFAAGGGLNFNYEIFSGLSVGLAPQYIVNVRIKDDGSPAAKELDAMLRIAYTHHLLEGTGIYVEALPGYSLILPPDGSKPAGLVVAFGAGLNIDMSEHAFANFGVGYQLGFQNVATDAGTSETRTKFLRVSIGGGVRF